MPSGPPELHEKWCNAGPTSDGDFNAIDYLKNHGYVLTRHWFWILPSDDHNPTDEEWSAIDYLILEWDFGSLDKYKGQREI